MAMYQCSKCGCAENTALGHFRLAKSSQSPVICSACYTGKWHNQFDRTFYPKGKYVSSRDGLTHVDTGEIASPEHGSDTEIM